MRVRAVNLRGCDIKFSVTKEIAHYVSKASSLQTLNLRDNDIDSMGAECLAKVFKLDDAEPPLTACRQHCNSHSLNS
jgi:hypothetical protein